MPTIYLHIGTPKTGTTALQNFLPVNEEILEKNGICYPDLEFRYPGVGMYRNAHFLVTTNHRDEEGNRILEEEQRDYEEGLQKLKLLGEKFSKIILSDEGVWRQSIYDRTDFWEKLKTDFTELGFDVKIIVYFRRQDLFVQSHWAQKVKEGARYDFHEYLSLPLCTEYPLDYYQYMDMLAKIFGKEALIIRVFERKQFGGENHTIQEDFLEIFGLKMSDGFILEKSVYNTSLQGNYLEIKRVLNSLPEFKSNRHLLISTMKAIQDEELFEHNMRKYTFFASGEQKKFMEQFDEANSKLAREFLNRKDGKLFYDEIKEEPEYKVDSKQLLFDTIVVYGRMVDILNEKCEENRRKNEELSKKLEELKDSSRQKDAELKKMIRQLEETSLWFRLRRKWRHITGRDAQEE